MTRRQRRFVVAVAVLAVVGPVTAFVGFHAITSFTGAVDDLATGPIPEAQLELDAGEQQVFLEGDLFRGVKTCQCPSARRADVDIEGPDGRVPTEHTNANVFQINDLDGVQIARVDIPEAGRYTVRTHSTVGDRIAVGRYDPDAASFLVFFGLCVASLLSVTFTTWAFRTRNDVDQPDVFAYAPAAPYDPVAYGLPAGTRLVDAQLDGLAVRRGSVADAEVDQWMRDAIEAAVQRGEIDRAEAERLRIERLGR